LPVAQAAGFLLSKFHDQRQTMVASRPLAWKDADPGIPILKQAQAEHANLN
jgi:hypothetical protein